MRHPAFCRFTAACLLITSPVLATAASLRDCGPLLNRPVQVSLTDGRTPRGVLSPKSNDEALVLTTEVPGIAIESRFAWRLIEGVEARGFTDEKPLPRPADPVPDEDVDHEDTNNNDTSNSVPIHEHAPVGRALDNPVPPASMLPEARLSLSSSSLSHSVLLPDETPDSVPVEIAAAEVLPDFVSLDHRRAVRSLNIRATVANWDRDAEIDGLLLHVQPLDGFGVVVPVDGIVDVQLATETKLATGGRSLTRLDNTFNVTERWSVPIRAIDFDAAGTTVKLPFRRFHPERQFDIASSALAMAKLKLPTAGVFEASDPFVQLRPYSRFRDELQQLRGQRLFPGEATPR